MNIKKWEISPLNKERAAQIAEKYSIPFFLALLLEIRGFHTQDKIEEILYGDVRPLSDPFLMKDMDKAVRRIRKAVDESEKIAVYGDYDADGVTSTAMLFTYLEAVGADVTYYIPKREGEGYGLNIAAVETLHEQGVELIITVDNGISSVEEVDRANELGMDVVVTDHHRPQEKLPNAAAVVDAYRSDNESPFIDFCGAGVVLKLLIALEDGSEESVLQEYVELAALGTIGDVVPVTGENRTIVKAGLQSIMRSPHVGVSALLERCSAGEITASTLAFTVIPRLNATGRMGSPDRAVRLLCCDYEEEASLLADEICADNDRRRQVEAGICDEAMAKIESDPSLMYSRVIVVSGKEWHHGVIGIVAARITERYGKPCFVVSDDGDSAKGSGRSVEGFSLFEAVSHCADVLTRFGGHPMAAGVTLPAENIDLFRKKINEYAATVCGEMPAPVLKLDCRLNPSSLTVDMPKELKRLEPFGSGNLQPLFGLFGMEIREIVPVGGGGHLRIVCQKKGAFITCMRFGVKLADFPYDIGDRVDLAVSLDVKEYRGEDRLTTVIRDIRLSGEDDNAIHSFRIYEKLRRGEALTPDEKALFRASREEFAFLYRTLAALRATPFGIQKLAFSLKDKGFTLGKLLFCLDVLEERGLARTEAGDEMMTVTLNKTEGKVDIFASPLFDKVK